MSRIFSILILGIAGYFFIRKRYKLINWLLRSPIVRQYAVSSFMKIPGIREKMIGFLFPKRSVIHE